MTAPDCFGVAVRSIGFYYAARGIYHTLGALTPDPNFGAIDYIKPSLAEIGLGLVIIAAANVIVMIAYRTYAVYASESGGGPDVWTGPSHANDDAPGSN